MPPRPGNQHVLDILPERLVFLQVDDRRRLTAFFVGDELDAGMMGSGLLGARKTCSQPKFRPITLSTT
jgi:hypothetical protein